jgi:hypothetical protein
MEFPFEITPPLVFQSQDVPFPGISISHYQGYNINAIPSPGNLKVNAPYPLKFQG